MTERTRPRPDSADRPGKPTQIVAAAPHDGRAAGDGGRAALPRQAVPPRLAVALALAASGALLLGAGALTGMVASATAAFPAWPLLLVLDLLPAGIAGVYALRGASGPAAGVLTALALFAPGRALADLQFAADAGLAARPELLRPTTLAVLHPGPGLWLSLLGHAATVAAGLLAWRVAAAETVGGHLTATGYGAPERRGVVGALCLGLVAALGLVGAPFTSDDPYLVPRAALDAPTWVMAGMLLVAAAVVLAAAVAATTGDSGTARGRLLGTAAGVAAVAVPPLVAGAVVPALHLTWGPCAAVLAAVLLAGLACSPRWRTSPGGGSGEFAGLERPVTLPGQARLEAAAGVFGLLAGITAVAGAITPQLVVSAGLPQPSGYAGRLLLPAGVLVGGLGLVLVAGLLGAAGRSWGSTVRPAFVVALAAVPLAATEALDAVFTATQVPDVQPGAGVWLAAAAIVPAALAAGCAGLAGGVERDDVDLTARRPSLTVAGPAAAAALLAVGAFGLPALRADDYVAPGLWGDVRTASWGLLAGLATVIGAAVLAPLCRPARAAALLFGAAGVVGVRLLDYPLTGGRAAGAVPGPGTWLAAACAVALLLAAGFAVAAARRVAAGSAARVPWTGGPGRLG